LEVGVATLIVLQGPDKGRTLQTSDDVVLLGRGSAQVPLTDQTISRRHAELMLAEDGWVLQDLDSANGTYVNGVRIHKPTRLKHGDQIRVGSTLMVYTGDESVQQFSGSSIPTDLVTLDAGGRGVDSAVVTSVPSSDEGIVLEAPETLHAVKAWKVMRELSGVISSLLPREQLLSRVVDVVFQEMDVDHAVVFVRDDETGDLLPEVVRFRSPAQQRRPDGPLILASRTIVNHVVQSRAGVLCSNVVADKRFESGKSVQNLGMRSVICAPIMAGDAVLGVMHLDCPVTRHTYNEHELRLVTAIGHQTGLALENARLMQSHMHRERLAAAGEAVAHLSHYIKNILQGMRSGAEIVQRGLEERDLAATAQGWRVVERNLDRSYNLMLNMLAISKPRAPRFELLHLDRIIAEVVELVQKQADAKQVVLLTDFDDDAPPIPLDFDGVHQVVLNILNNAIDAVEARRGIVNVRTKYLAQRNEMMLSVADNGPGVPDELRDKIFEPFYSSKGQGGTGLGLAAARKIVAEVGGAIELVTPAEGGADFRVYFSAAPAKQLAAEDTQGPPK
jgi:signal transduction histidine kinase